MAVLPVQLTMRGIILRLDPNASPAGSREFLTVQRAEDDAYEPGKWEFPGGKVEPGELPETGWHNECYQETGLLTRPAHPLTWTYKRHGKLPDDPKEMIYMADFGLYVMVGGILKQSHEHAAVKWVNFQQFVELEPIMESWEAAVLFHSCNLL